MGNRFSLQGKKKKKKKPHQQEEEAWRNYMYNGAWSEAFV
jgi:hypothetical protein